MEEKKNIKSLRKTYYMDICMHYGQIICIKQWLFLIQKKIDMKKVNPWYEANS